jgi:hypothetical protein
MPIAAEKDLKIQALFRTCLPLLKIALAAIKSNTGNWKTG